MFATRGVSPHAKSSRKGGALGIGRHQMVRLIGSARLLIATVFVSCILGSLVLIAQASYWVASLPASAERRSSGTPPVTHDDDPMTKRRSGRKLGRKLSAPL